MKKKIAIIGSSAPSCIYALKKKAENCEVTIFEKSNNLGGAWAIDKKGPKFSNLVAPLTNKEKKYYYKACKILRKYHVKFKDNLYKSLFSKKVLNAPTTSFDKLYDKTKKNISIKKNFNVKSIIENSDDVLINNKFRFHYVYFPTYINLKSIIMKKDKKIKVKIPFLKINKALHLRVVLKGLKKNKIRLNQKNFGPLDRFQIIELNKKLSQINGRVLLEWKKKRKKLILKNLLEKVDFTRKISSDFFWYRSCIRDDEQIKNLKSKLSMLRRVRYLETTSLLGFVYKNLIKNENR